MMIPEGASGLLLGAVVLGAVHGVEPGHGWPVAASYALDQSNKWLYGFAASLILGIGHLVSSIAMVGAFFYAKSYFELTQVDEPIALGGVDLGVWAGTVTVGGPVSLVAGVLLILLGIREYRHGHGHDHGASHDGDAHSHEHDGSHGDGHAHDGHSHHEHAHDGGGVRTIGDSNHGPDGHEHAHDQDGHEHAHDQDGHEHTHDQDGHEHAHDQDGHEHTHDQDGHEHAHGHGDEAGGLLGRLVSLLPFLGGDHSHARGDPDEAADRGLWGIAWFAFLLGFAHEEEFEIIALCAGSAFCLELMTVYALTVVVGIVTLTLLLIAGYQRFEERVAASTDYLPVVSAAVLVVMGLGFVTGLF